MNEPKQSANHQVADDEIDIGQLFSNIWRTKWRVLISLVLATAVYGFIYSLSTLRAVPAQEFSQVYELKFSGLRDGRFPDGSPFVLSDVIGPTVLSRAFDQSPLADYGLTLAELRAAISVEPYSNQYFLIRERYQRQMSSNLSAAELGQLQERMATELQTAQSGAFKISLQFAPGVELPAMVASQLMNTVVDEWASRMISELGVLRLSTPIYSERIFDEQRFANLDYLIGIELLIDNIRLINGNVESLKQQPNAASIQDPETGYTLEDLSKAIKDVEQYDLRQLIDPVRELGLTRNDDTVRLFYNRQMRDLELEKRNYRERARVIKDILSTDSLEAMASDPSGMGSSLSSPQLGDAFLDRLVDIARQGDAQAFRQEMLRQVLTNENRALDIAQRMAEIQVTLDALDRVNDPDSVRLRAIYAEEVEQVMPQVLATLRDYTRVIGRIHAQLGRQAVGNIGRLVQPQGGSFEVAQPGGFGRNDLLKLMALLFVVGFISLFVSLVSDMMRRRQQN